MKKKILSLLLCLCMVVTLLPTVALATGTVSTGGMGFNYGTSEGFVSITLPTTNGYYTYGTCSGGTAAQTQANDSALPATGWNWAVQYHTTAVNGANYTLYLKDFNNAYIGADNGFTFGVHLNLVLMGDNRITTGTGSTALYGITSSTSYDLTISGPGSLTAVGGDHTASSYNSSYGICAKKLTVNSGAVNATGGTTDYGSYGIFVGTVGTDNMFIVNGGTVNAVGGAVSGTRNGMHSYGISVTGSASITGGTVHATGGTADNTSTRTDYTSANSVGFTANTYTGYITDVALTVGGGTLVATADASSARATSDIAYSLGIRLNSAGMVVSGGTVIGTGSTATSTNDYNRSTGVSNGIRSQGNIQLSGGVAVARSKGSAIAFSSNNSPTISYTDGTNSTIIAGGSVSETGVVVVPDGYTVETALPAAVSGTHTLTDDTVIVSTTAAIAVTVTDPIINTAGNDLVAVSLYNGNDSTAGISTGAISFTGGGSIVAVGGTSSAGISSGINGSSIEILDGTAVTAYGDNQALTAAPTPSGSAVTYPANYAAASIASYKLLVMQPLSAAPTTDDPTVAKTSATQAAVEFTLTNSTPYENGQTWTVYAGATGDTLATGVTATNAGNTLALTHATDIPVGTYHVSVTENGKAESTRLMLTVEAPLAATEITAVSLTGITAPSYGVASSTLTTSGITPEAGYTVTGLAWQDNDGNSFTGSFGASTVYKAEIVLTADATHKFSGTITPTVNAGSSTVGVIGGGDVASNTLTFTVTFPATGTAPATTYAVTVYGSYAGTTGAGNYAEGTEVTIQAGTRDGYGFTGWTTNPASVGLSNASSATTSFSMPANAVSVTANWSYNGGGGGGYTPPTTYDVPVETSENSTNATATVSGGTATVSVNTSDLNTLLDDPDTTGNVSIDAGLNKSINTAVIPATVIDKIADAANDTIKDITGLTVALDSGSVELDAKALAAASEQAKGSTIAIHVEEIPQTALNAEQRAAITEEHANALIVEVTITSGNTVISNYAGGQITVTLPYELEDGQDPAGVCVWHLASDGTLTLMECTYDEVTKTVSFVTDHLSDFIVGYDAVAAFVNPFTDVAGSDWFYNDVAYAYVNGLMKGTSDTTFDPHGVTSRGMIVTILYRLEGEPAVSGSCPFDDVASGKYYENAVAWAAANKIVEGYGNGKFGPDDSITREQMAAILYRYADFRGYDVTAVAELTKFADSNKISSYASEAMSWANANGLITGVGNDLLDPQGNAERCQVAAILHRFCENVVK